MHIPQKVGNVEDFELTFDLLELYRLSGSSAVS